ncbi:MULTISPECIES: fimbrial protein [unclassified Serratia (in: enterobacteria)]|uniref:fimbrial protein n=1 Tax=unclassified Serratia (in: enterobacteria) TaxID=2647522 RepID=UPI003076583F
MKILFSIIRYSALFAMLAGWLGFLQQAHAATGDCWTTNASGNKITGTTYAFSFQTQLTDPNLGAVTIPNASGDKWNAPGTYNIVCSCTGAVAPAYITTVVPSSLPAVGGGKYQLNDFLQFGGRVHIVGNVNQDFTIPLQSVSNGFVANTGQTCNSPWPYSSGATGQIDLYITRSFTGTKDIAPTDLLYVYIASLPNHSSPDWVAKVSLLASQVTVPQSCEINPAPVTIDLGEILAANIKTAGAKPTGYTPVSKQLILKCRNIQDSAVINLSFKAEANSKFSDALKTDNNDIAVRIEDKNGNVVAPNGGLLPVDIDYGAQQGTAQLNVYPINTSGNTPAVGTFNATGTVTVTIP